MAANSRYANGHRRRQLRARILATETTCGICGQPVDKTLGRRADGTWHPLSPEIDEIIPVSLGGDPLARANTRLAHRWPLQPTPRQRHPHPGRPTVTHPHRHQPSMVTPSPRRLAPGASSTPEEVSMDHPTCSLDGCDKPLKRASYCYGHYMKNWRYGTPTPEHAPQWEDLRGQRFGLLVVSQRVGLAWSCTCDCGAKTIVRTGDLNRGSITTCGNRSTHHRRDDSDYGTAHDRIRRDRGHARNQACTDCSNAAQHWSYDHTDPDERISQASRTHGIAYSLNPQHYSPRCVPCHKRFDLDRRDALHAV